MLKLKAFRNELKNSQTGNGFKADLISTRIDVNSEEEEEEEDEDEEDEEDEEKERATEAEVTDSEIESSQPK
jgi:hypothetical protein